MGNLAKVRRQFTLILGVLGVIDLLLIIYLLLPGSNASGRLAREKNLQDQAATLTREVTPLRGIDKKLSQTRVDLKKFNEQQVPGQYSQISQHLEKLMQETGVSSLGIRYGQTHNTDEKDKLPGVQKVDIETTVTGEYGKVARFINAMEQDKLIFIIDDVSLNSQENGVISLQIKAQTFLKES